MLIYTIGYGGRSPQEFLDLLGQNGVQAVVDVRLRPDRSSMGCYTLAKTPDKGIQGLLARRGVGYFSVVQLGNLFMQLEECREPYRQLLTLAGDLLAEPLFAGTIPAPFCLMCSEKRHVDCHLGLIAEFLERKGYEVRHIE